MKRPHVIGIVGGIASGKSTVTRVLAGLGCDIIDADKVAHDVLQLPEVVFEVRAAFGDSIWQPTTNTIDRKALGKIVFAPKTLEDSVTRESPLGRLESIVQPRIRTRLIHAIEMAKSSTVHGVVLDVPLLLERGYQAYCDRVLFIDCPDEFRRDRAMARGWTESEWRNRESRQMSIDEKRSAASDVLPNCGSLTEFEQAIERWYRGLN
jgi:dephospho-CoA kinase